MEFTVKYASFDDLEACVKVEKDTMGSYCYLEDCWHYFQSQKGELICVYHENEMVGIGRFTVLPDNSAWLETLRVTPKYQGKGVGKLIYKHYLKLAEKYKCVSIAMFTGVENKASKSLAIKNGLTFKSEHTGYHLSDFSKANSHDFKNISWGKSTKSIIKLKDKFNDYMVINRTFYHINNENIIDFASNARVYQSESDSSIVVCGSRFQHSTALHIAIMSGDYTKCIEFAISLAKARGVEKVSCTFSRENEKLEKSLVENGFIKESSNLITMEKLM
ncbi:MAG: GNAT family N-acetyltransferase [Clostridia bacterium]